MKIPISTFSMQKCMQPRTSWKQGEIYIWRKEELFDAGSRNQNNVREKVLYMGALYGIIWDGFEFFFMQSPETLTPETILNAKFVSTCWQRIVGLQQQYTKTKNTSYL